ncbi:MAG TPA: NAD(P)-dependent oxidoreductase [Trebonia sp.]|nr:NAD(P)-dependent oxidoreductase [Trebonia sp.]
MRIFLAGATGVIGQRLVPLLVAQGHQVTGLARSAAAGERLRALGASAALADVFDPAALADAVAGASPEVVIHQLTDLSAYRLDANSRIRQVGTRNLVDAARMAEAGRMVAQSISWAYQPGQDPAAEDVPLDLDADAPRRGTVAGVAALEAAVRELPEWVLLRYGLLYGPGTWYAADGLMADRARAGELAASADVASFVHVDDAATAAAAALSWPTGAVNVCDDEPAAGDDWVPVFCASVGAPPPGPGPGSGSSSGSGSAGAAAAGRQGWARGASNRHARSDLGWTPSRPSWRDGFGG